MNSEPDMIQNTFWHLFRTSRSLRKQVKDVVKQHALTNSQYLAIKNIPEEGIPLRRLACLFHADPGNVTGIADRLERDGLIFRKPSQKDRRVIQVFLSKKGKVVVEAIRPVHRRIAEKSMSALNKSEISLLDKILTKLDAHMAKALKKTEMGGKI